MKTLPLSINESIRKGCSYETPHMSFEEIDVEGLLCTSRTDEAVTGSLGEEWEEKILNW